MVLSLGVFLFTRITSANTVPPTAVDSFFMDTNGDLVITGTDVNNHNKVVLKKPYTYDTLQPQNTDQDWNTCDTNGDAVCTGTDVNNINKVVLKKPVSLPGDPWVLTTNLPASGNLGGTWIAFQDDLTIAGGATGIPGVSIVVTVASGTATLDGRSCTPVPGTRDQNAAGASCALGVSITNLVASPADGYTETGSYGLQINGSGTVELLHFITINTDRDIPETSVRTTHVFGPGGDSVSIGPCVPNPVNEGVLTSCPVTSSGTPLVNGAVDTCGGSIVGSNYEYTPGESMGGLSCVAAVITGTATDQETINVTEVNVNPVITSTCGAAASEGTLYSCSLTGTDADLPAQTLTFSKSGSDTCGGSIAASTYTFTPSESQGGGTCVVGILLSDSFVPAGTATQNTTVTVAETNVNPVITSTCSAAATELVAYTCNLTATDADLPAQTLTWSKAASDTCGGSVAGAVYSWTPTEAQGGAGTCVVGVTVSDSFVPAGTATQTTTVTPAEVNSAPSVAGDTAVSGPVGTPITINVSATDPDLPTSLPGANVRVAQNGGTCTGVPAGLPTSYGAGSFVGTFTYTPLAGDGATCTIIYRAGDNAGTPLYSADRTLTVTKTTNVTPTLAVTNITVAEGATSGNMTATSVDPDPCGSPFWGRVTISKSGGTCGGTVTGLPSGPTCANSPGFAPTFTYTALAEEPAGTCTIIVHAVDGFGASPTDQTATVTITEVNQLPVITSNCGTTATEGTAYTCALTGTDADLPAQTLTWAKAASDTCGGTVTGTNYNWTPTESQGGGTCVVGVQVSDSFVPAGVTTKNATVTVAEVNVNPVITSTCGAAASEGALYSCALTGTDADLPAQTLTFSKAASDTCGGAVAASTYTFTPTESQGGGTCVVGILLSDSFAPAGTATQNTTVTVTETNQLPVITSNCATTATEAVAYVCALTGTDADLPAQTLTWAKAASDTCGGTVTGTNYNWTPTESQGGGTCVVGVQVSDSFVPAGVTTKNATVTVTETNVNPVITSTCATTATEGVAYTCALTATDADLPAQTLTWSKAASDTCGGTVTGTNYNWTPTEAQGGAGTCVVGVQVSDSFVPAGTATQTTTVTPAEVNVAPIWSTAPVTINVNSGQVYNQTNGIATDADLPANTLTCSKVSQTCTETITVSGSSTSPVNCNISFTAGGVNEACNVVIQVQDNGTPVMTLGPTTVAINVSAVGGVTHTGTSTSANLGGIRGHAGDPVARIVNNYPADFGKITINFSGAVTACAGTATCTIGGSHPMTGVTAGSNCTLTDSHGYLPSNDTCVIAVTSSTPACSDCGTTTDTIYTSLRLTECDARGGMCGGFIDGNNVWGTGDGLEVDAVDYSSLTGALVIAATNQYVYALVEHSAAVRMEQFDNDRNGIFNYVAGNGLISSPVKVTVAYKGDTSNLCDFQLAGDIPQDCYMFTTMSDVDSKKVRVPMGRTGSANYALPEARIWGYIPLAGFIKSVGSTPQGNVFPNPLRGGFVVLNLIDQSVASIDLTQVLRSTGDLSTLTLCFGALGTNVGGVSLPGNLVLPDVIRQNWTAACNGNWKQSPASTTFSVFTERPSVNRIVVAMGASVNTKMFNLFKSLNVAELPITMVAYGTQAIAIPAIPGDINVGDVAGNWGAGSMTPHSVPFEFDYRDPSYAGAIGRRVNENLFNLPPDPERVKLSGATPAYADPNRGVDAARHVGQMYILGEELLMVGARTGSTGLMPFQLKLCPQIDDAAFTVFQRMNTSNISWANDNPWSGSSTNSYTVSDVQRGLPSTAVDTEVNWATARVGGVGTLMRGFVEGWAAGGPASTPASVPGSTATVINLGPLEGVNGTTFGINDWLPIPSVTSPAVDGYRVPPQADSRGWPANRNGQLMRGTATTGGHMIVTNGDGSRNFVFTAPQSNVRAKRADIYILDFADQKHVANGFMDPLRGYPKSSVLWRFYGAVNNSASITVMVPFIMPRTATLNTVTGTVPDPFEAGNFTNQPLEWTLTEHMMETAAYGIGQAFSYQDFKATWVYDGTYQSSTDSQQFIWH